MGKWADGIVKAGRKVVIMYVPDVDAATATDSVNKQNNFLNKSFRVIAEEANKRYFENPHNKDKDTKIEHASVIQGEMEVISDDK